MADQLNYSGATVFWLYIVAALGFTSVVILTIVELQQRNGNGRPAGLKQKQTWFIVLAVQSFAVLSFNMLHVLIKSFNEWLERHPSALNEGYLTAVWQWSITSTLFQDFGQEIVANSARYMWTQSELLATLSVCLYIGIKGQESGMPRLWAFFGLSQILPISFAQNLFYLALLCQPLQRQPKSDSRSFALTIAFSSPLIIAYGVCLSVAEASAGTDTLIPIILLTRMLLMAPMLLPTFAKLGFGRVGGEVQLAVVALAGVTTAYQALRAVPGEVMHAVSSHPAVSALGFDFFLSFSSYLAWINLDPKPSYTEGSRK